MSSYLVRTPGWILVTATILAACTFDFSPYEARYACGRDEDCAIGWVCVAGSAGGVCARPVDAPDPGDVADADVTSEVEPVDIQPGSDSYLVVSDVTFVEAGDGIIERLDGAKTQRFFMSSEPLTLGDATRFCESLTVGGHVWRLGRATEMTAISQCCLTRPGRERCSGTANCYNPESCEPNPGCLGCGTPPDGWACWWHPTFDRPCGVFWAAVDGDCASAFDFRISERVTLGEGALANVLCTSSSEPP